MNLKVAITNKKMISPNFTLFRKTDNELQDALFSQWIREI